MNGLGFVFLVAMAALAVWLLASRMVLPKPGEREPVGPEPGRFPLHHVRPVPPRIGGHDREEAA